MSDDPYTILRTPPTTPPVIDPDADPEAAARTAEDPEEQGPRKASASKNRPAEEKASDTLAKGRQLEGAGEDDLDEAGSPGQMISG